MTNTNVNIFDLMLGIPNKTAKNQLGLLESIGQNDVLGGEMPMQSFDMIFGNMLQTVAPELLGNVQEIQQLLAPQMEPVNSVNTVDMFGIVSQDEILEQEEVPENVRMFNKELQELMPQNKSSQNINIKEILAQQNIELENGQYKVLSKEVADSKVALTLEGKNGKQLTITLPIESMQNTNVGGMQSRVLLQDSYYLKELESFVEKVDIKQIEIKSVDANISSNALKPVEISLVGEQNSAVVTLKASLKKNQIRIEELQATTSHQKAAVLDESGLFDEKQTVRPQVNNMLIEKMSIDSNGQIINTVSKVNQQIGLKGQVLNQSNEQVVSNFNVFKTDTSDNIETKENIQNVRMQIPEDIKSQLRPNGQSVVIKMNPENLGPAKLSLSFSDGKLRAKLEVTSLNAKHALDGSMTKLVDQLQKINIIVDKIDVTLDSKHNQNQQFQQRPQWQRKMSFKNIDLQQFEQNEFEQAVQGPVISAIQQGAGSVNYLA